jgi:hypothetical protein
MIPGILQPRSPRDNGIFRPSARRFFSVRLEVAAPVAGGPPESNVELGVRPGVRLGVRPGADRLLRGRRTSFSGLGRALALASFSLAFLFVFLLPRPALAARIDVKARQGITLAKRNNCAKAVPILEEVELERHRPSTAEALAGCYAAQGELVRAAELYRVVGAEKPIRGWTRDDHNAKYRSKRKAAELDARLPSIKFKVSEDYEDLEIELDGRPVTSPNEPRQFLPDAEVTITARAKDRKETEETITLSEGERRVYIITLEKADPKAPAKPKRASGGSGGGGGGSSSIALGARFRGMIIPKFLMNAFGEGGTTLFAPGGDLTLTAALTDVDIAVSLGYSSYRMGEVAWKPKGRPDTEFEILQSDLQSVLATVDLLWNIPLDKLERVSFRVGGGIGVGWTFAGNLYRTQAYAPSAFVGDPYRSQPVVVDPSEYVKCGGPNAPVGTFRYCNQLDKDADHYNGYTEPSWFNGGVRPLVYPWVTFPQVGISWRIAPRVTLDIDGGLTISGFLTAAGLRYEL